MENDKTTLKLEILKKLILIRLTELTIAKHYPEQTMRCPTHLCLGQEASGAIFGTLSKREDLFFGYYRSHGHYLGKGGSLLKLFLELLGSSGGCSAGMGGSMHLVDESCGFVGTSAIVGATIPQAAGAAMGFKLRREPNVVIVFFGDAACEEGVTYETINFSLLHQLPLIFVCENNHLAVHTKLELRTNNPELGKRFSSMGLPARKVSGSSAEGLISLAQTGFEWVRSGRGPFFIECEVERWAVHVGPAYEGAVDLWWQEPGTKTSPPCPIADLVSDLVKKKIVTVRDIRKMHDEIGSEIEETFERARQMPQPETPMLEDLLFSSALLSKLPQKEVSMENPF